ncbi:MAG: hypothetical protein WB495_20835 [Xanthobacteraceae bacterium]
MADTLGEAPITVEDWMGKRLSRKEAEHKINQIVFGVDYKTDKRGEPIEQGLGSA